MAENILEGSTPEVPWSPDDCSNIEKELETLKRSFYDHLKGLGLSLKLDVWVPHVLTERNLCRCMDVCDSLLKRHKNDPFLKRIITGDEKGHGAKKMNRLKPFFQSRYSPKKGDAVCLVGF
ncbi:histone-lysine N-methyltransferase SETMAR [Trichonephila clavipes]|nr:histone-lysine N-methyltransferase SETMAR [Trichonephila clavipes]